MRHRKDGKKLGRNTSHRTALWRNMAASLFQHGAIRTTEAKAKQLRRFVEKLITTAKAGTLHARRQVLAALNDREMFDDDGEPTTTTVVQKLFDEIAPRYADRPGGYTRIIRLAERRIGDAGKQVLLQLVEETSAEGAAGEGGSSRRKTRAAKRHDAAEAVAGATAETSGDEVAEDQAQEADATDGPAEAPEEADDASTDESESEETAADEDAAEDTEEDTKQE